VRVILLERVAKLGKMGEVLKVKPGFARNYLIPKGRALLASKDNIALFERERGEREKRASLKEAALGERAQKLEGLKVSLGVQATEEGKLFGSVSAIDIVRALTEQGHAIKRSEVHLPMGPIRAIGTYEIELHLEGGEVVTKIEVLVSAA